MGHAARDQIDITLRAAYAEGLISSRTLAHRLDEALGNRLIDRRRLIGDLSLRAPRPASPFHRILARARSLRRAPVAEPDIVLTLDWSGETEELLVGRSEECGVVLEDLTVSRRHAVLHYRDGVWALQDVGSRNGTTVNGVRVGRSQIRAGDRVGFGDQVVLVD